MSQLLVVNSSPFIEQSNTRQLVSHFVPQWLDQHPAGKVVERDLAKQSLPHIDAEMVGSYYTDPSERTEQQKTAIHYSELLVDELEAADTIVIGVPMHNFGVPSVLKAYIDHVARVGRTFRYTESGPEGLLKGKKAYLLCASGGRYKEGTPMAQMNHQDTFMRTALAFIGITDVTTICAEGMSSSSSEGVEQAKAEIDALFNLQQAS